MCCHKNFLKHLTVVPIPAVSTANEGFANNVRKLIAALAVEFRLLFSERSLPVVMSLAVFLSILEVTFWPVSADPSFSAAYAGNTARSMLLFLVGIPIFYIGEAIHRDSDVRVEGLLWSHPIPNYVILSAKFLSTLLLVFGLILSVGVIAIVIQIVKGNTPLELSAYLKVYLLILVPNAIFLQRDVFGATRAASAVDILPMSQASVFVLVCSIFTRWAIPAALQSAAFQALELFGPRWSKSTANSHVSRLHSGAGCRLHHRCTSRECAAHTPAEEGSTDYAD